MVAYRIPSWYERCHYMYLSCDPSSPSLLRDDGGPIIDLEGKVVGLVNNNIKETFISSFLLHKCLDFWRRFNCMPRLHLGMTFTSIKHLDSSCIERMTRNHNIESGLIVEQVSKGSHAEKIGIREGDVIESFNGKYISTTIEVCIFSFFLAPDTARLPVSASSSPSSPRAVPRCPNVVPRRPDAVAAP
ncbi:putative protease Do-like 14 [Triticum dicoccoides]|uniref:putative protease Do-like 14 n=1 Tax=Triticum dicoccoides TaxID=85692 RepID=UPI0018912181|nr:putative protease Do-like 14 [Triticum dicoccoides]